MQIQDKFSFFYIFSIYSIKSNICLGFYFFHPLKFLGFSTSVLTSYVLYKVIANLQLTKLKNLVVSHVIGLRKFRQIETQKTARTFFLTNRNI